MTIKPFNLFFAGLGLFIYTIAILLISSVIAEENTPQQIDADKEMFWERVTEVCAEDNAHPKYVETIMSDGSVAFDIVCEPAKFN